MNNIQDITWFCQTKLSVILYNYVSLRDSLFQKVLPTLFLCIVMYLKKKIIKKNHFLFFPFLNEHYKTQTAESSNG